MDDKRLRNAQVTQPENMTVGELNQAVRDLRELLYQKGVALTKVEAERDSWIKLGEERLMERDLARIEAQHARDVYVKDAHALITERDKLLDRLSKIASKQ